MANSEVQLKRRFEKWRIKKYIPEPDLKIMLSMKRKRQEIGKDARFQWRGHDVEQERIERASKRIKGPLVSPECELVNHEDFLALIPILSHSDSYQDVHFTASEPSKCTN
jgi:hypothetical protein